jgi:hypothetical protein
MRDSHLPILIEHKSVLFNFIFGVFIMKNDGFDNLRAIASGQGGQNNANKIFWKFDERGNLMGTIVDFNQLEHQKWGTQYIVEIRLADTGEIASAFMNGYIRESMRRNNAKIGDKVLIMYLGRDPVANYHLFDVRFGKSNNAMNETFHDNLPF